MNIFELRTYTLHVGKLNEAIQIYNDLGWPALEKYKKNNELTMLLASHNMKEVERLCNSVVMMKQGKIVDRGTCNNLINKHGRENLEATFLKIARSKNELE